MNNIDLGAMRRRRDSLALGLRDLILTNQQRDDTGECRRRLAAHADEVKSDPFFDRPEYRDLSRTHSEGGFFVPPAWCLDQWVEFARPGRTFANLITNQPLPGGTDSINVPVITAGTNTAIQAADNTQVFEQDLADSFINSPVITIAGQQSIALQLIDQGPLAFDQVVLQDLAAAQSVNVDQEVVVRIGYRRAFARRHQLARHRHHPGGRQRRGRCLLGAGRRHQQDLDDQICCTDRCGNAPVALGLVAIET
jgi:hypothetical protein